MGKTIKFTEEEIKSAIDRYNNGETITDIAASTNRSRLRLAAKMKEAGCIITPINKVKHFDETKFDSIDTADKAYWLGFLFADGNIGRKDNSIAINLLEKDADHLRKFNKFLSYDTDNIKVYTTKTGNTYSRFYCKNLHMHELLNNLGCVPQKSKILQFPEFIRTSKYFWDFIRGYFDGDGCLTYDGRSGYREPRCSISCGSKDFLYNLSEELSNRGFQNKVRFEGNIYILHIGDRKWNSNADFMIKLYKDASVYLDRKYQKYLKYQGRLAE